MYSLSTLLKNSTSNIINNDVILLSNLHLYDDISKLCKQYPLNGYTRYERSAGEKKQYRFEILSIKDCNLLSREWRHFISQIISKEYISLLFKLLQIDDQPYHINVSFFKFAHGDWVDIHLDNEDKIVTNVFYFNSVWDINWGGHFNLYDQQKNIILSTPPLTNFSVAIKRSDQSYHSVTPLNNPLHHRNTLQLEILKGA